MVAFAIAAVPYIKQFLQFGFAVLHFFQFLAKPALVI